MSKNLASMVYKFFRKRSSSLTDKSASSGGVKNKIMSNLELGEELHKPINRKFEKREINSPFIYNMVGAHLANMQLISKFYKGIHFLLCVIDIFSKYTWVVPLKDIKRYCTH